MLVFGTEIEGARVLEVWRENNSFVPCFTWQLHAEVPRFEGDEGKLGVVRDQVFLGKLVEAIDGVTEGTCVLDVLPGESGQTGWKMLVTEVKMRRESEKLGEN